MKNSYTTSLLLKQLPLFSDFSKRGMEQLLCASKLEKCDKNQHLFLKGAAANAFFVVIKGWIKLYRDTHDGHEFVLSLLTRGCTFGNEALVSGEHFPYNAEAVVDTELLRIPANFVLKMNENHHDFDHFFQRLIEMDIKTANKNNLRSEHLTHMTAAQRIGCFLLKICKEQPNKNGLSIDLPYEKSLIALQLGMPPETFSRSLNHLSAFGVETKGSRIIINNVEQLAHHVCEHCSEDKDECATKIRQPENLT